MSVVYTPRRRAVDNWGDVINIRLRFHLAKSQYFHEEEDEVFIELNGTFHLSLNENICSIA